MDRIITDFQGFTRSRKLDLSEVTLRGLVEAASQGVAAERKDIGVAVEVPGGLTVEADEVLLRQALANLVQNAADAMRGGGKVIVAADESEGKVRISVSDTGHGIDRDMREKVFLPFFTTKEKGTGLGLAIVHRTIVDHSGEISLESSERGTTVRVTLPARQPAGGT